MESYGLVGKGYENSKTSTESKNKTLVLASPHTHFWEAKRHKPPFSRRTISLPLVSAGEYLCYVVLLSTRLVARSAKFFLIHDLAQCSITFP